MKALIACTAGCALLIVTVAAAQTWQGREGRGRGMGPGYGERMPDRRDYPMWENAPGFESDVFTFARVFYNNSELAGGRGNRWRNDYPDSDWNFSYRLQQLTSLKVDPNGRVVDLNDPAVFDYPFLFMNGVGSMELSDAEARNLGRYCLNGGFIMVDDFWCEGELDNVRTQFAKALPGIVPQELPLSHEIFHIVYDLKSKPQVPDIRSWSRGLDFEIHHIGPIGDRNPHFLAYHDDHGRIMILLCHNNDLGDGWEREGANHDYFERFSVPMSYPMGINILTYAMTH